MKHLQKSITSKIIFFCLSSIVTLGKTELVQLEVAIMNAVNLFTAKATSQSVTGKLVAQIWSSATFATTSLVLAT